MFTATKRMFTALTRSRCAGIAALFLGLTTAPGFA